MLEDVRREAEQKGYNLQKDSFPFICRVLGYTKLQKLKRIRIS